MTERYRNFIGGKWVDAKSKKTFKSLSPSNLDDVVGEFAASGPPDVDAAVQAATKAFASWRRTPAPKRAEFIYRAGEILRERKEEIAREMTREMGKVLKEARGDVQEGIDTAYHHAGEGRRLFGFTTPSELANKWAMAVRQPVGVAGLITPWNFPLAIPTWKMFPALVAGNTVILKPASDTPNVARLLVKVMEDAGIPAGVVNFVTGSGGEAGMPLVKHPDVRVISFTGSVEVGSEINGVAGRMMKRTCCELGGKNAIIVMDDADIDLLVDGVCWGAFGTTGQRCTATSRLIVHKKVHDEFMQKFVARAKRLTLGDGRDESIDVGPVVNAGRVKAIHDYVQIGKREAKLVLGGEPATEGALKKGAFYRPTIFDGVKPSARIAREEIFGPVLSVLPCSSLENAIAIANDVDFGLSSSIYTKDITSAFRAIEELETGIVYVNAPTIGAEAHLPFGGWKNTGNGHREGAHTIYDVFCEWKTVYVDYSGRLQRAQIDNVETSKKQK